MATSRTLHTHVTFSSTSLAPSAALNTPWLSAEDNPSEPLTLDPVALPDRQSGKPGCFASVINNVLSTVECERLIENTERCGYEQATVTTFGDQQVMASNYRCERGREERSDEALWIPWRRDFALSLIHTLHLLPRDSLCSPQKFAALYNGLA